MRAFRWSVTRLGLILVFGTFFARVALAQAPDWTFSLTNPNLASLPGSTAIFSGVITNGTGGNLLLDSSTLLFETSASASSYTFDLTDDFLDTLGVIPAAGYSGSIFYVRWAADAPTGAAGTGTVELSAGAPTAPSSVTQSFTATVHKPAGGSVVVNYDPGTPQISGAASPDTVSTYGDMMAGMRVIASFADGTNESLVWGKTGFRAGGVFGSGWSLTQSGYVAEDPWVLTNLGGLSITSLLLDAGPGNITFDTDFNGRSGTPGSNPGGSFEPVGDHSMVDIVATYRDQVGVGTNPPIGDLFRHLDITFEGAGLVPGSTLRFNADVDNFKIVSSEPGAVVPEPGSWALMASGLGLLAGRTVRRRQSALRVPNQRAA